ncbi:hypothetical protein GQ53DRAFT_756331 [Thozetella sp. PMI_491]|nr:hypothetical protein GQ53DRAFT_756331 [Thozetella sp. PMI_491]
MDEFHHIFAVNFFADYYAYRATMPYLLEQGSPKSTWTFCTGGGGDNGYAGVTSIAQGALFSMAAVICHEKISVRFNELYLCYRVDYDSICEELGKENRMSASEFSGVYQTILANPDIRDCRVSVFSPKDVGELKYAKKLAAFQ